MVEITNITVLKEQVKIVARARQESGRLVDEKMELLKQWEQEHRTFFDAAKVASEYKTEQENLLRELTLQVYAETGEKKPCEGVGIREITKLEYDPKLALEWAKKTGLALNLDKMAFERIARADKPEFVELSLELQATIAQDLKVE